MRPTFPIQGNSYRMRLVNCRLTEQDAIRLFSGTGAGEAPYLLLQAERDPDNECGAMEGEEGGGFDITSGYVQI